MVIDFRPSFLPHQTILENQRVEMEHYKYLGTVIDNKLSFEHSTWFQKRANNDYNFLEKKISLPNMN